MSARRKAEGVMKLTVEWFRLPVIVGAFMLLGFSAPPATAHDGTPINRWVVQRISYCAWHPHRCQRTPQACYRDDLGERIVRLCDQIRFRHEPHYLVVNVAPNGGIRSFHLLRTRTGREVLTSYPYGLARAIVSNDPHEREVRMRYGRLKDFWRGRPVPGLAPERKNRNWNPQPRMANARNSAPGTFFPANGLPLGWNNSVGAAGGECIEFTMGTPTKPTVQTSFTSVDQASSTAEQINLSATVSGAYAGFEASDTFSYSDSYQASANSGFQYWNLANIYTLNTVATGLSAQGNAAYAAGTFPTVCGTQYMTTVLGGFYATISMSWNSSSASTSTNISDQFSGSYGLDSLKAAATVATSSSDAQAAFTITQTIYGGSKAPSGGGETPNQILSDAFATESNGEALYALCGGTDANPPQPDPTACQDFAGAMASGAENASGAFTSWVNSVGPNNGDASGFVLFPSGVAGIAPNLSTLPMPTVAVNDILIPYASDLQQYLGLLNQVATLGNRASHLATAISTPSYNPTGQPLQLDISDSLGSLANYYNNNKGTKPQLKTNLTTCLNAVAKNVKKACAPVVDSSKANIATAYDFLSSIGAETEVSAKLNCPTIYRYLYQQLRLTMATGCGVHR